MVLGTSKNKSKILSICINVVNNIVLISQQLIAYCLNTVIIRIAPIKATGHFKTAEYVLGEQVEIQFGKQKR